MVEAGWKSQIDSEKTNDQSASLFCSIGVCYIGNLLYYWEKWEA